MRDLICSAAFLGAVLLSFLSVERAYSAEKFCSASGTYYCKSGSADPVTDPNCSTDGESLIDPEVYPDSFFPQSCFNPNTHTFRDWEFSQCISPSGKETIAGVSKRCSWSRSCRPIVGVGDHIQVATFKMYECNTCRAPYSWSTTEKRCVKYCPPEKPILNLDTGSCEAEAVIQPECTAGNPVIIATGEKVQIEAPDIQSASVYPLVLQRNYRSYRAPESDPFVNSKYLRELPLPAKDQGTKYYQPTNYQGIEPKFAKFGYSDWEETTDDQGNISYIIPAVGFKQWKHNYDYEIVFTTGNVRDRATLKRPDGRDLVYQKGKSGEYFTYQSQAVLNKWMDEGNSQQLGWRYRSSNTQMEYYDLEGRLLKLERTPSVYHALEYDENSRVKRVVHSLGDALNFEYDGNLLTRLYLDSRPNESVSYSYDERGNVSEVGHIHLNSEGEVIAHWSRQYHYEDIVHPYALTGITDERGVRYTNWAYDTYGRVIESAKGNGEALFTFLYNGEMQTSVTNPLGKTTTYHYRNIKGGKRVTNVVGEASENCAASNKSYTYYTRGAKINQGRVYKQTDWKGSVTLFTYDTRGLETRRFVAFQQPNQRVVNTVWHPTEPWPIKITTDTEITEYTYDGHGNVLTEKRTAR